MRVFAQLPADQLRTAQHVRPLVVPAELHIAAVFFIQHQEIIALHDHIVEFQERKSAFHTFLIALMGKHPVHAEVHSYIPEHFNIIQIHQPVRIVDHQRFAVGEINEFAHLLFETLAVVLNRLHRHHLPQIASAGRISHHRGTASDQRDRFVSRHLQTLHQTERHKMSYMKAVRRRIKPDIESGFPFVYHFPDLFFVGHLGDQAPGYQFVIYLHLLCSFSF